MSRAAPAAALTVMLVMIAPACRGDHSRSGQAAGPVTVPFVAVDPESGSRTDQAIADAQATLRNRPNDDTARLALANAFLQKVRETADPSLYTKAAGLLDDLGRRLPRDPEVLVARGTLALAQHRFEDALALGKEALRHAPGNPTAYGVLVDANNELGRYDDALAATQDMVDAKPGLASYSRVSYARELRGDYPGAIEAMQQAVVAAGGTGGENVAYVQTLLGQLLLTSGDVDAAEQAFASALEEFPGYAPARAGQAQALVARDLPSDAADLLAQVVKVQPLPQFAIAHGDALTAAGRNAEAEKAYELVDVIARLFRASGVQIDLEMALFAADHQPGNDAVSEARRAVEDRPSGFAHDVLAWNLFRTGKLDEAAAESRRALALGSLDPQEQFHAAAIADARGDRAGATEHLQHVLDTNPRFSARLLPEVEQLARRLGLELPVPPS